MIFEPVCLRWLLFVEICDGPLLVWHPSIAIWSPWIESCPHFLGLCLPLFLWCPPLFPIWMLSLWMWVRLAVSRRLKLGSSTRDSQPLLRSVVSSIGPTDDHEYLRQLSWWRCHPLQALVADPIVFLAKGWAEVRQPFAFYITYEAQIIALYSLLFAWGFLSRTSGTKDFAKNARWTKGPDGTHSGWTHEKWLKDPFQLKSFSRIPYLLSVRPYTKSRELMHNIDTICTGLWWVSGPSSSNDFLECF